MAWQVIQLVLGASVAVSVAAGAIIAAWRMIPTKNSPTTSLTRLESLEDAVEAIRLSNIDLADKYEITIRRNNVRVGRLRAKVARLKDEEADVDDDDGDDQPVSAPPAIPLHPAPAEPLTKAQMWQQYNASQPQKGDLQ
ncbi:MAG TPA: hypothetical protein ENH80_10825 [Phycisphaerae bacterium]|nr:hypothetical protein [Phycisphaerae bacterium]